jgi:hypothetical protein
MRKQLECTVNPGEYMAIPKGTVYHQITSKYASAAPATDPEGTTTRDQVVKMSHAYAIHSDTETITVDRSVYYCSGPNPGPRLEPTEVRKIIGYHVFWGDNKYVEMTAVTPAAAPVRKAPDPAKAAIPKAPTLRMRMVKGTKWKLTSDANIMKSVQLPPPPGANVRWVRGLAVDSVLPIGTVIEIIKFQSYGPGYEHGVWVHIQVGTKSHLVEYKQINQNPEQVGEAEVIPVFYIWDTAEKKYYSGYDWDRGQPNTITYADKLSKAKSFKMLNLVRTHALIQSGYYDDLPEAWGSIPDWMQRGKAFDIPDTWEIVKIDKLTKKEIERIELVDTFKRTWKLRSLTIKYGSAVRAVYSALEKKDQLKDFSAMLAFSLGKDKDGWFLDDDIPEDEKDAVKELLKQFDKKDIKVHKSAKGFAVAAKDADTAMMVKLAYSGNLECALIDFNTMGEVVANGA